MSTTHRARPAFPVSVTAVVLFQFAALIARSALDVFLASRGVGRPLAAHLSYLVVPFVLVLLMAPYLRRSAPSLRALFARRDLDRRALLLGLALGLDLRIVYRAAQVLYLWAAGAGGGAATAAALSGFECPPVHELLAGLFVMTVLVPLVEETGHRGFVLHALLPRGRLPAVVVSAASFAVFHAPGGYAWTFVAGLLFAVLALNLRSLWAPVIAHATYNAAALLDARCVRLAWQPIPGDPLPDRFALLSAGVLVAGAWLALWLVARKAAGRKPAPAGGPSRTVTRRARPSR